MAVVVGNRCLWVCRKLAVASFSGKNVCDLFWLSEDDGEKQNKLFNMLGMWCSV